MAKTLYGGVGDVAPIPGARRRLKQPPVGSEFQRIPIDRLPVEPDRPRVASELKIQGSL